MSVLRARAPGKVNLCLFVGPTREDGLHELVSVIESVSLADDVELAPAPDGATSDEVVCRGVEGPNVVAAALAEFRRATGWDAPPQRVTVTKRVPVAGGMGGGSADAAATLRLAAHAAGCDNRALLHDLAFRLGADVPSQLEPGVCLVTGAGENVKRLEPLEEHAFVVVPQPFPLSTRDVFAELDRLGSIYFLEQLAGELELVRDAYGTQHRVSVEAMSNDLELAARSLSPAVGEALEAVWETEPEWASLSGSGPTAVGVFVEAGALGRAREAAASLRLRFPSAVAVEPVDATFGAPVVGAAA